MERRKVQVTNKLKEIITECNTLQENLQTVVKQISSSVEFVNHSPDVKVNNVSQIFSFQLDFLKKVTEFNFELEIDIEETPNKEFVLCAKNYESQTNSETDSNSVDNSSLASEVPTSTVVQLPSTSSQQNEQEGPSQETYLQFNFLNSISGNLNNQETGLDIDHLKENLKKFSEKIGLNGTSLQSMENFYQKSSLHCTNEPSQHCSVRATNSADNTVQDTSCLFEFPEKDTNFVDCSSLMKEVCNESSSTDSSVYLDSMAALLKKDNCNTLKTEYKDSSPDNSSSEDSPTSSANSNTNSISTAAQKLNNMVVNNKSDECANFILPHIKLKPADGDRSPVTKNRLNQKQNDKKKKNKKKKEDYTLYEIQKLEAPSTGTECVFSHVESPNEFYIHLLDNLAADGLSVVDKITEDINDLCKNSICEYNDKETACRSIGKFCFVYVAEYDAWFRGEVLDWFLDKKFNEVLVQLVDFGNKKRTLYKNLRKLTREATEVPALALRCHLPLMYPPNSTRTERLTIWPVETIEALVQISRLFSHDNESKLFKLVYVNREGDSLAVDLFNISEGNKDTVGEILLNLQLAEQIVEDLDLENFELEEFLEDTSHLERVDNINEAIVGYDARDEARICRFTKPDGSCFKGKNCKLEHVPLAKGGYTTDMMSIFREAMYDLNLPTLNEVVIILITCYIDSCTFFAQIIRKMHKEQRYTIDLDLYSLLDKMNNPKIVQKYEAYKNIAPALGEVVIVKHWSKKWLRGVVRELIKGKERDYKDIKAEVFIVDFGDTFKVSVDDLRKIRPEFLELPFQGVKCYIAGYMTKQNCSKKAEDFFNRNLYFHNFIAHVESSDLPLKVSLKTLNGFDVGKTLVDEGVAQTKICDINPKEDLCLGFF